MTNLYYGLSIVTILFVIALDVYYNNTTAVKPKDSTFLYADPPKKRVSAAKAEKSMQKYKTAVNTAATSQQTANKLRADYIKARDLVVQLKSQPKPDTAKIDKALEAGYAANAKFKDAVASAKEADKKATILKQGAFNTASSRAWQAYHDAKDAGKPIAEVKGMQSAARIASAMAAQARTEAIQAATSNWSPNSVPDAVAAAFGSNLITM